MTSPIRVLHLITGLNTGGAEMTLFRLLSAMDRQVFEVQVVCMIPIGPVGEKIKALEIPVTSLEMPPGRPTLRGFRQLLILVKQFKPTILQTWLYHADLIGLLAAKLAGVGTIVWNIRSANMEFEQYGRLSGQVFKLCAFFSGLPKAGVINSRAGQTIHTQRGYHPKQWVFIPNGIDTIQFRADSEARRRLRDAWEVTEAEFLVGLVGRFDPMKDHPTFLKAAAIVRECHPKVCFVCVGDGPDTYLRELKELAGKLKLARLLWPGPQTEMPAVYNGLDLLVSSSSGEGFPNVVAEAMACEKPCVVTNVGDSALLIAETGQPVAPGDPAALASAILRTIELSQVERAQLGKKARQRIEENFSLVKMVRAYSELYGNLSRR